MKKLISFALIITLIFAVVCGVTISADELSEFAQLNSSDDNVAVDNYIETKPLAEEKYFVMPQLMMTLRMIR